MISPAIQTLITLNVVVYLLQGIAPDTVIGNFALWPLGEGFAIWQLGSYAFLHGNLTHILFNMLGLWMFGTELERAWGSNRFAIYYGACVLSAGLTQLGIGALMGSADPTIGASGGVYGLLLAFAMRYPNRIIVLLFPPIPMPAWLFAIVFGGLELFLGVTGTQAGVAHFAHLGGMLGGFLLLRLWSDLDRGGYHRR